MFREHHDHPFSMGPEADSGHAAARLWFESQPGTSILAGEAAALSSRLSDCFGYHLVQVGALPGVDLLRSSRILSRTVVDLDGAGIGGMYPCVRGRAAALPVESDSVDVVILPHVLEFEPRPHEALREAARVLVPEGRLFVTSFNPMSMLGLWRILRRHSDNAPWNGRFLAQGRMRDWLALVGLELASVDGVFYRPPLRNARMLDRLAAMEPVGRRLLAPLCGAYVLGARKRIARLTPVRPALGYRPRLVGVGLAGPSARFRDEE